MNRHPTIMEGSCYLQMMGTCIFSQVMVEWQETHLGNMGMLRTSKELIIRHPKMKNVKHLYIKM